MDAPSTRRSVVESPRPSFSEPEAAEIAERVFGLAGRVTPLSSERDQAFLVGDGARGGGVLKISNAAERAAVIDMEAAAVLHVLSVDPEIPLARPIARRRPGSGLEAYRDEVAGPDGVHLVRMSERLLGRAAVAGSSLDAGALRAFGAVVARLGRAMRGFRHEQADRELLWDLQHVLRLRPWVEEIEPPDRRALVSRALDRFERRALPRWAELRSQVIHGDVTLENALLDERSRIGGIVDFGDMSHTALVVDLSSALESLLRGRDAAGALRAARSFIDGYEGVTPLEPLELELVADLTTARTAMTLVITTHQVAADPSRADYIDASAEGYWHLLEVLDGVDPGEAAAALGAEVPSEAKRLGARRGTVLGSALTAPTYDPPLYLVRGEGTFLFDEGGRAYLDAYNNVPVLGHSHPRVTGAIARQSRRLATNMRYLHHAVVELAERLVETMPPDTGLDTVLFVNSGSEANDLAWRIARAWTGRTGGIVTEHAYHGISDAIAALSPEEWRAGAPSHVETIAPPDPRRIASDAWAAQVDGAAAALAERSAAPAVVMIDAAFTSDGVFRPDPGTMRVLVERSHAAGALYVADEVQVGHGRSGEALWSFVADGIAPDLVTLGKPMGNGFPIAAVVTRAELVDRFATTTEFFSTFGGSPPAAAAALGVLAVIEDEGLVARAEEVGGFLEAEIVGIGSPTIEQVRRRGLTIGVELAGPSPGELVARVLNRMRDRGVLIGSTGPRGEVLKIRPPLSITLEEAAMIAPALAGSLAD